MKASAPAVTHLCGTFSVLSETFLYDLITEIARGGVRSTVLTFRRERAEERPFQPVLTPGTARASLLRLEWLGRRLTADFPGVLYKMIPSSRRALAPLLDRGSCDVLHCHFGPMAVLAHPLAVSRGLPLVASFYGYDVSRLPRHEVWAEAYRRLWPALSAALVLSEEMAKTLIQLGCPEERIHIVRLGYPRNVRFRLPARRVRHLLSVGRLVKKKGHVDAVRALATLTPRYADATLRIIGEGPERKAIQEEIDRHGLSARVSLMGAQPREVVLGEMAAADAFVLCSKTAKDGDREGTPTTLIEAAATGLPCIATRHAGIPEIIAPDNHWLLADEGDVEGIANCLDRLLAVEVPRLRQVAESGARHVRSHFHLGTEAAKTTRLYEELQQRGQVAR